MRECGSWRSRFVLGVHDGMVILQTTVTGLTAYALRRFVLQARKAAGLKGTANVLVTASREVQELNLRFRGKNKTTDVLSFPATAPAVPLKNRRAPAGDIVISADIAAENAAMLGHSAVDEVKILALHGILHLAGLDHERDNGAMARRESELRRKLRLPMALIERASAVGPQVQQKSGKKKRRSTSRAGVGKS
jgi:probable rRNA maturation factor